MPTNLTRLQKDASRRAHEQAKRQVARLLRPPPVGLSGRPPDLVRRWAQVANVNGNGTVDLALDGGTIPQVAVMAGYGPVLGDAVLIDFLGTDLVVMGTTAGLRLAVNAAYGQPQPLPYATGWGAYSGTGFLESGYYLDAAGRVQLEGIAQLASGTIASGATSLMATLPAGFRPAGRIGFSVAAETETVYGGAGRVDVDIDGSVYFLNPTAAATPATPFVFLNGISYRQAA